MAMHGLDRAQAAAAGDAKRMLDAVGGHWWNVYIGGPQSGGSGWTPGLVNSYVRQGIDRFMLTYVGRQHGGPLTREQGKADGKDALRIAKSFGYTGAFPLCLDVERPTFDSAPTKTVEYVRAWCERVQKGGARPGVYANPDPLKAMAHGGVPADFVWITSWVSHSAGDRDPHRAAGMPPDLWSRMGQRAWQYAAQFDGRTCRVLGLDVDISVADPGCLAHAPGDHHGPVEHHAEAPPFPGRVLRRDVRGDDVEEWQQQMKDRGWHLEPSGTFDAKSEEICRMFQEEKGLDVTGTVNHETWDATWAAPITP
jgi:glycoside hydrolase-like protein/putative peptidoglycan binding protein